MRIITFATLREYSKKHADADVPLRDWYKKTEKSDWSCLADIKQTFNSVDYVGNDRFVFNIKGNEYRLVAIILFAARKVFIRFIGTHKEKDKKQYDAACARIEELLKVVSNNTPTDDKNYLELDLLSDLVADYEEEHFPVETPLLVDVLKLRMYEMNLTQTKLSELLSVSPSRVSEYLSGKCEPTLKVARDISRKLNIDANIVLGV